MIVDDVRIDIEGVEIPQSYVISFSIQASRIERSQKASVELVKKKLMSRTDLLKEKAKIKISACYKGRYPITLLFAGVISKPNLKQRTTIKLDCEDYSYLLKEPVTMTFVNMYDSDIIGQITSGLVDTRNVKKRKRYRIVSFTQKSRRWIIHWLAEKSLSDYFFSAEKLYFGEKYSFSEVKELPVLDLKAPYIVRNELNWHEGSQNLQVLVVGSDEKGRPCVGKAGSGSNIRKVFDQDAGKSGVQDKAKKLFEELSFRGYKGSLKTMLEPVIWHSQPVEVIDNGIARVAFCDSVTYSFSLSDGLRQTLKLGEQEKEKPKTKGKRYRKNRKKKEVKL